MNLDILLDRATQWKRGQPDDEIIKFVENLFNNYLTVTDSERIAIHKQSLAIDHFGISVVQMI